MNIFEGALERLKKAAEEINFNPKVLEVLSNPQRVIEVNLPLIKDSGELKMVKGYRVQYNNFLGPYKGGLRYHQDVDMNEVKSLAFWMMIKNALIGVPFGGGKGGLEIDPKNLSAKELEILTREFAKALAADVGPNMDVPAPDVNTNAKIMDWFEDEYSKIKGDKSKAVVTGKSLGNGGSEGREEATGLGGVIILEELIKKMGMKTPITVAVQGFGNVGSNIARILYQRGFKVISVSDVKGAIYDSKESGFNIDLVKECRLEKGFLAGCYCIGSVCDLAKKYEEGVISNEQLLELEVDVLIPAALENVITEKNAKKLKAKIVLEMANGPTSLEADEILNKKGIVVVPDVLANSGGVTVSYFEWYQNMHEEKWSKEKVNSKLEEKMVSAFEEVWQISKEKKVNLRLAAYIVALQRLAQVKPNP